VIFRRIRGTFPWRTAALLAMLFGVPVLAFAAWFVWEIEPLQSYYLFAYRQCSKTAEQTGLTTEIRWLMKTAPGRASRPAIPSDVATGWTGNLSIRLSSAALHSGWIGLEKSAPEQVHSTELKDALCPYIYDGLPYSNLIAFPLFSGSAAALMIAAFIAFTMRAELWQEWQHFWRQVTATDSVTDDGWDSLPIRHKISQRIILGKWLGKVSSKLVDWAVRSRRNPIMNEATIPVPSQDESPQGSVSVQPAESSTKLSSEPRPQTVLKNPLRASQFFPEQETETRRDRGR
jgi:hypothetical protein